MEPADILCSQNAHDETSWFDVHSNGSLDRLVNDGFEPAKALRYIFVTSHPFPHKKTPGLEGGVNVTGEIGRKGDEADGLSCLSGESEKSVPIGKLRDSRLLVWACLLAGSAHSSDEPKKLARLFRK